MNTKKTLLAAAVVLLAGCASTEVKENVARDYSTVERQIARASTTVATPAPIILPMQNKPYLGLTSMAQRDPATELPRVLRSSKRVKFSTQFVQTAEGLGRLISEETGLPVKVVAPPVDTSNKQPEKFIDLSPLPPMEWQTFLNTVLPPLGLDWEWADGVLRLEASFRRTYHFGKASSTTRGSMQLGKTSQANAGTTANTGNSGNFSSKLDSTTDSTSDMWTEATASLKSIAGERNVIENRSLGFYSVSCSKACHKEVKDFVDQANHIMQQQVMLRIVEMTVSTTSTGQSGVNWNMVYQSVSKKYGFSFGSPQSLVTTAAGSLGMNIFTPVDGTANHVDVSALFSALSAASKVVDAKPFDLIALNNEPTTLANTDQQTYVQQTTVVPTGTSGTPVFSQVPGYVTFGQLIQVTPTVMPGGRIAVRFGLDDTKLKKIITGTRQGDIDKVLLGALNFNNQAIIKSGSTLILSGFKRRTSSFSEQGLFEKQQLGSETGDTDMTETIIMITPYLAGS